MTDFELFKQISNALDYAEHKSRNNIYILSSDTFQKIIQLEKLLCDSEYNIQFDRCSNSIEILLYGFVLESQTDNLKFLFQIVDLFVIDAMKDGKICIEMKILNAAKILRRL